MINEIEKDDEYQQKRKIGNFLNQIGMKHTSKGYCYWQNAILYYLKQSEKENGTFKMENVYNYIARYYKTTRNRTEKAMRWAREQSKYLNEFSEYPYKITNKEFLILCAEKILKLDVS